MVKRISMLLAVLFVIFSMLSGCGASKSTSETAAMGMMATNSADRASKDKAVTASDGTVTQESAAVSSTSALQGDYALGSTGTEAGSASNPILDQRKVIRSANITTEVDDFDAAYGKISSLILGIGFVQETNINTDRVYIDNVQKLVKNGTIVLRVDRSKFDKVLNGLKEIGAVTNWSIQGEDVTEKYYDTESRLKLLRLEEERVIEYLKKITDPDKIISYESRLTSIRQEIESLTGTLRKISDLVDLSTITITMNEKYPGSDKPAAEKNYWDRLGEKFMRNMESVLNFCGDFVIFIVSALPVLLLLGLIIWLGVAIYRKVWRLAHSKNTGDKATSVGYIEKKEKEDER